MKQAFGNHRCPGLARPPPRRSSVAVHARAVQFRPCIDIHEGQVKQIVGSTLQDLQCGGDHQLQTNFESEQPSSWYAELYKKDELAGGHVIMLGADEASQAAARSALAAYPGGLQLGGGVTSENAVEYLEAGASHVIVTSYVFREGRLEEERLADLVKLVGKQRLVLDLSCRKKEDGKYYVVTDRWQKFSELALSVESVAKLAESCDEFLVHGVDVEGMQLGIDDELVQLLGTWSPIPVTYAGGARTLDDLERVRKAGGGRVDITVGSALDIFGGQLPYADVVAWHKQQQAAADSPPQPSSSNGSGSGGSSGGSASGRGGSGRGDGSNQPLGEVQSDGTILFRDIHLMGVAEMALDGTYTYSF